MNTQTKRTELPIIVGGFYRSGTSLMRRLLDSHSCIHCGPEVKFFKDFYGDYINDELRHVRLFRTLTSLGLNYDELLPIFGDAFIEAHKMAAKKACKPRWADKNPENVLYLPQWNKLLPSGFLFIHVVRHPLDALASLKESAFPKAVPADFEEKVRLYLDFHANADAHINASPGFCIRVKYEDLATNPVIVAKAIFSFLGEDYEPEVFSEIFSPRRGNGIEDPKIATTRSIHDMSIGRWRNDLNDEEINITKEILGDNFDFALNCGDCYYQIHDLTSNSYLISNERLPSSSGEPFDL